ncbi:MAG: 3-phosphoglycerate kinase [Parcubacteria group bacterium Gr01-1014_106]|nr:MAG: 3-phosphoglycerate kinase [Parcubacteria group bacterium Gr01-1014_106]
MAQGQLRTLRGVEVQGKRVLLRVDCNVAVDEEGRPMPGGEQRLRAILPTIQHLQSQGARTILLSHLGRPGGKHVETLRLENVARQLRALAGFPIRYVPDIHGAQARAASEQLRDGEVILLENLRFDAGEEKADLLFAEALAALGELVVQDAFSVSHRKHASVAVLSRLRPSYAGLLLEKEVAMLERVLTTPERPAVAILGGAKLETKLGLMRHLLTRVDVILTGGGIANTLLRVGGASLRVGLVETQPPPEVTELLSEHRKNIQMPTDVRVVRGVGREVHPLMLPVSALTPADDVRDIGPETAAAYCAIIAQAKTCVWNGPVGKFEEPPFDEGTKHIARCVQSSPAFSVVGGGDTVRAISEMGLLQKFTHVSTGGGAMLTFLEGAPMPGLEPLYG